MGALAIYLYLYEGFEKLRGSAETLKLPSAGSMSEIGIWTKPLAPFVAPSADYGSELPFHQN
jgi:hypothetical protein